MSIERAYITFKPDGVERSLDGEIIAKFQKKGYKLVASKMPRPERLHREEHLANLIDKKSYPGLIEYAQSGLVVCVVCMGVNVMMEDCKMFGATKPHGQHPRRLLLGDGAQLTSQI